MRLAEGRGVGGGKWRRVWRGGWREEGGGVGEGGRGARCVWVCAQSRAGGAAAAHVMRMQIQATDMPKFDVNQYLHLSRIDSGIDSLKAEMSGHEKADAIIRGGGGTRTGKEEEVESEEEEEEEEDDGEDVEGEVAQHRELGDREVGRVCVSLWGRWKGGGI